MKIDFDINWYGNANRRSAVCDYIEILAMTGNPMTQGRLADAIYDARWIQLLEEQVCNVYEFQYPEHAGYDLADDDEEEQEIDLSYSGDRSSIAAGNIHDILCERSAILGDLYPFDVGAANGWLLEYVPTRASDSMYLALLSISVIHAITVRDERLKPHFLNASIIFEKTLVESLNSKKIPTTGLGHYSRSSGFSDALKNSCSKIGIDANPDAAPFRRRAKDEGCDVIGNLWPLDPRQGGTYFAGQATCASSDSWKTKLFEVPSSAFKDWLGRSISPLCFLSVPHHVQDDTLHYLISREGNRDILDRLRLCFSSRKLLKSESTMIEALLTLECSPFGSK